LDVVGGDEMRWRLGVGIDKKKGRYFGELLGWDVLVIGS
jgi:hypothetical protein